MAAAGNDGFEWFNAFVSGASALVGAVSGIIAGTWRVAQIEPRMQVKMETRLAAIEIEMRDKIAAHEKASMLRTETLVDQFRESFSGMRRQIDENRLRTEQEFLRKEDFRDFRDEYREDMRELKESMKEVAKRP
jgi:hypothetical protein